MVQGKMTKFVLVAMAGKLGSYGWTGEVFWRPKVSKAVIQQLYGRDGLKQAQLSA